MVNLRYHIVSITAVFLALGLGIAMGSTFLGRATLDRIDSNVKQAAEQVRSVNAENGVLRKEVSLDDGRAANLIDAATPRLFNDTLNEVPILVLAADGVDQTSLDHLRAAIVASGAQFDGTLTAKDKLTLGGGGASELAAVLGTSVTEPRKLRSETAQRVAAELLAASVPAAVEGPPGTTPGVSTTTDPEGTSDPTTSLAPSTTVPDEATSPRSSTTTTEPARRDPPPITDALIDAGYFDYQPTQDGAEQADLLTQRGYRYVVVTGADATLPDADFVRPLVAAMTEAGPAPVVVASAKAGGTTEDKRADVLKPLIDEDVIGDRITTVDDLETLNGLLAVVWSLQDLGQNRHGHYGFGDGAKSQLPAARG